MLSAHEQGLAMAGRPPGNPQALDLNNETGRQLRQSVQQMQSTRDLRGQEAQAQAQLADAQLRKEVARLRKEAGMTPKEEVEAQIRFLAGSGRLDPLIG